VDSAAMRPISWSEAKRREVLEARGVDIVRVARILETREELSLALDARAAYGETRFQAIGRLGAQYYFLVYAKRRGTRHLITAWRLNDASRRRYENRNARRH
jgi:uncharacterized DUF497 family protein